MKCKVCSKELPDSEYYPQAYEIIKTSGEYFLTKDKEDFIKKLLDILG